MTVEQSNFFFLKVKLLESSSSPKINWIRAIIKSCRADFSSNRNSSSSPCPVRIIFLLRYIFVNRCYHQTCHPKICNNWSQNLKISEMVFFGFSEKNCQNWFQNLNSHQYVFFGILSYILTKCFFLNIQNFLILNNCQNFLEK